MKFCYYDFELSVPKEWTLAIEKKANYQSGMLYFTSPNNYKIDNFWDKLDKYTAKTPTVGSFMKSYFDGLRANRNLKELNIVEGTPSIDQYHETFPHELSYTLKSLPFSKVLKQKIIGNTIYCKATNRFVAIYAAFDNSKENPDESFQREAVTSFKCMCTNEQKS